MKDIRNKKTGEIVEMYFDHIVVNTGSKGYCYDSIKAMTDEWEDIDDASDIESRIGYLEKEVEKLIKQKKLDIKNQNKIN